MRCLQEGGGARSHEADPRRERGMNARLADLRHEAKQDDACERAERAFDAAISDMPRDTYNALAVEYLAEIKQETAFRAWLRDNANNFGIEP
jgi:uncharacterized membrane protein